MVIVDDIQAPYGRMVMCHMLADTTAELVLMADRIGVDRKWLQAPGTLREHFDICLSKRALAVQAGAQEVTMQGVMDLMRRKRDCEAVQATRDGGEG